MKKQIVKPLAAWAFMSVTLFGCASSNGTADNTGMVPTDVVVTETEVATGTTPDGTPIVVTDTDVVADTTLMVERQNVANSDLDYNDMFDEIDDTEQYDLLALAKTNPNLSTFVELVELADLAPLVKGSENITVFAPTNAAFNSLSEEKLAQLVSPSNRVELRKLLNLHVVPSELSSAMFKSNSFIDRGDEEDVAVNTDMQGNVVYVGGAQIVKSDVEAANGVLHVVNGIIQTSEGAGADND